MNYIKNLWNCLMCKLFPEIQELQGYMEKSINILNNMEKKLEAERDIIAKELDFHINLLGTIGDTIPDMLWAKDITGCYIYANESIKENLLFDCEPLGKDDICLSLKAKDKFGKDNHTFGEKCSNSDKIVLEKLKPMRFLESGNIKGKKIYLEVYKAPLYVDGIVVGVVGAGRDLTEYVEAFRGNCNGCDRRADIFAKYEFEG